MGYSVCINKAPIETILRPFLTTKMLNFFVTTMSCICDLIH